MQKRWKLSPDAGMRPVPYLDGTRKLVGPSWKDMWGRTEHIIGGPDVKVDAPYVTESILAAAVRKVVEGFAFPLPAMPPFQMKPADINALIELL